MLSHPQSPGTPHCLLGYEADEAAAILSHFSLVKEEEDTKMVVSIQDMPAEVVTYLMLFFLASLPRYFYHPLLL